jgi:hypothetical protein
VRPEPTQHRIVREFARGSTEVRHQLIDRFAFERPRKHLDCFTNQLVPFPERERKSRAANFRVT